MNDSTSALREAKSPRQKGKENRDNDPNDYKQRDVGEKLQLEDEEAVAAGRTRIVGGC